MNVRRIQKDLKEIMNDPPVNCTAKIINDNINQWEGQIIGPPETPYKDGIFKLSISFPENYPFKAPNIRFITKVYHCNVGEDGAICLDLLNTRWTPAITVGKLLVGICSFLNDPNPDSPMNGTAADLYNNDRTEHDKIAMKWTKKYAK